MPHSKGWERRRDRRSTDPAPIGDVVDSLLAEDLFSRGIVVGRLASMWPEVVGERLAAETAPEALERGVLTVSATSGPWGVQAGFLVEEIRKKACEALGSNDIREVRVIVRNRR